MRLAIGASACLLAAALLGGENFGLRERQPPDQLPHSKAPFTRPEQRAAAAAPSARLDAVAPGEWRLVQGWRLAEGDVAWQAPGAAMRADFDATAWYPATVPGTVLATLVDQGVYPDPYYGLNNLAIPDELCRREWVYRLAFDAPAESRGRRAWLLFNGVNYRASIWLNGVRLGEMAGAFVRGEFDATAALRPKDNVLVVRVSPPPNPGIPHEESARSGQGPNGGRLCLDGPTFISSEGWDWVPGIRDRNVGLWQDVRLRATGDVTVSDPQVLADLPLPATDRADLTVRATLRNAAAGAKKGVLSVEVAEWPDGASRACASLPFELAAGASRTVVLDPRTCAALRLANPKLWWPNGYGEPNLYVARLRVEADGTASDGASVRFGVRELTYRLTVDAPERQAWRVELDPLRAYAAGRPIIDNLNRREVDGKICVPKLCAGADASLLREAPDAEMSPYLVICVNGVPVFCRGGNWGMDDAMKRVSRERLEPALRLHRDAGFTMVRNWTGESTEPEFFDLCDEYGLLVWNDFWYSTQTYNLDPGDHALFLANVRDTVRRYRNHPSLAIWCPRNEGWANEQLEPQLAALLASEDPTRYYQGNSRLQNLRPSGPWSFFADVSDYFTKQAFGFSTELGNFAVPTFETLASFLPEEDRWPIGDAWYYHDFHAEHNQALYRKAVAERYGEPADAEAFCRRAQLVNYESFRSMFEAWNSRMWGNASGLLLWMSHPAWPSMIWQLYTYDFETTGAYFGARKACSPLHVQMNAHDRKVVALNVTRTPLPEAEVRLAFYDRAGRPVGEEKRFRTALPANAKVACFDAVCPAAPGPVLARLSLLDPSGRVLDLNDYWLPGPDQFRALAGGGAPPPSLSASLSPQGEGRATVLVSNRGAGVAGGVRLQLVDAATGRRVLPAYFSDGWFSLLPGESRTVRLDGWREGIALDACRVVVAGEW